MTKKVDKTNAARLLDKAGIAYKLIPYEFDENDLAAQHVDALDDVRLQATLDLCNLIIVLVADTINCAIWAPRFNKNSILLPLSL